MEKVRRRGAARNPKRTRLASSNDNEHPRDAVDEVVDDFMRRSVALLRDVLREHGVRAPTRPRRFACPAPSPDDPPIDEVARRKAREIIERYTRGGR